MERENAWKYDNKGESNFVLRQEREESTKKRMDEGESGFFTTDLAEAGKEALEMQAVKKNLLFLFRMNFGQQREKGD